MIRIEVRSTEASIRGQETLTVGLTGAKVHFSFGPEWDGLIKTAVFRQGEKTVAVADIGQQTVIPWEVLTLEGEPVQIGIYGIDDTGSLVIPTVWAVTEPVEAGADPDADPSAEPTPGLWEQMLGKLDGLAAPMKVTVTQQSDGSYVADRSCTELLEAHSGGHPLCCQYGNRVLSLRLATKVQMVFSGVFTGQLYTVTIGNQTVAVTVASLDDPETAAPEAVLYIPQDLTDEQKAQARQNIGVDGASGGGLNDNPLELIAEITLEKETFSVIFDKDANGEPLELEDFELVTIARSNVVGTGTTSGHLFLNGAMFSGPLVAFKSEDTTAEAYRTLRYFNAGQAVLHGRVVSNTTLATGANSQFFMKVINRPITSVGVRPSAAADRFIAGSNFKLYGRRVKK